MSLGPYDGDDLARRLMLRVVRTAPIRNPTQYRGALADGRIVSVTAVKVPPSWRVVVHGHYDEDQGLFATVLDAQLWLESRFDVNVTATPVGQVVRFPRPRLAARKPD